MKHFADPISPNEVTIETRMETTVWQALSVYPSPSLYTTIYTDTSTRPSPAGAPPALRLGSRYVISSHGCLYRPVRSLFWSKKWAIRPILLPSTNRPFRTPIFR